MEKKRILLFIDSLGAGGAQRQLVGLALMLKARGFDVCVVMYHDESFYKQMLLDDDIPCLLILSGKLSRIPRFHLLTKQYKPDLVIAYLESPSIIACISKLFGRKFKLIVSERNTSQQINLKERIRFNFFRIADCVVPNSFSQQSFINKYASYLSKKTKVITNFVDTENFIPLENKKRRDGVQEIVVAASIWGPKNTLNFIEAVEILSKRITNFHISWYGKIGKNTPYIDKCNQLIIEKGLQKYIELLDKTKEIKVKYQQADLFCLPSFYEGTPNVIGEAIACGLPVVCSNVCDNAIYVKEGINGFLFDPKVPQDIADKLFKSLSMNEDT